MERIYLDYAATTPVDPAVFEFMKPYFTEKYGNPGSLHSFGQEAMAAVDKSRETIAKAIGADFREVVFTGSATEANNLALRGVLKSKKGKIIISSIEHESVLDTTRDLAEDRMEVFYLPVNKSGVVDLKKLKEALDEKTILVSVMYVNNEIGTIQPIAEISKIIKDFNKNILFHIDAVQAFQYLDCDVNRLGVDLMTLSAHKIYGPKGIGALYVSAEARQKISPIITGGGQEFGFRSGTENVASIAGFGKAVEIAVQNREKETKRILELRDYFWQELKRNHPRVEINGYDGQESLPNILNIYFSDHLANDLLIKLDMAGVAVSSGAACSARSSKPSHVLKALGLPIERILRSLRVSFGRFTRKEEIEKSLKILSKALTKSD